MSSWWRKIAELQGTTQGTGSWKRRVVLGSVDTVVGRGSWPRIAALSLGTQQDEGSWTRRLVPPNGVKQSSWARALYVSGGLADPILALNPFAWYDPSDLSTLFQDVAMTVPVLVANDPVGAMLDKSGIGRHLLQSTEASRPLYKTSGGLHWLEFTDAQFMVEALGNLTPPYDIVSAWRFLGDRGHLFGGEGATTRISDNSGQFRVVAGAAVNTGILTPANDVDFVITNRFNETDAMALNNGDYVTFDAGANGFEAMTLNSFGLGGGSGCNCRFRGAVIVPPATDGQIAMLRSYLAAK